MKTKPYIISVDPSGAYNEGKGTTGIIELNPDCEMIKHYTVEAESYETQVSYWVGVLRTLEDAIIYYRKLELPVVLSVEDYVLYSSSAKAQINSEMETSKLIGAITTLAYQLDVPMYIRSASQVMNRWTNEILMYKKIISKSNNRYVDKDGLIINRHCLDALRHGVHCHYFEVDKKKGVI